MMSRVLRFLGLAALFTVTTCAVLFVTGFVILFIHEWADSGSLGQHVLWILRIYGYEPQVFVVPVIWIAVAGVLYLVAQGSERGTFWRTVRAALGLTVGWYALVAVERSLWPALAQTTSPFDRPLLSAPLFLYILVAPWVLGRLKCRAPVKH